MRINAKLINVYFVKLAFIFLLAVIFCPLPALSDTTKAKDPINVFYQERAGETLWITNYGLNIQGDNLFSTLKHSWKNGLNPNHYDVKTISEFLDSNNYYLHMDKKELIKLELQLTKSYIKYMKDLSGMRIKAKDVGLEKRDWRQAMNATKALNLLSDNSENIQEFLLSQEPQSQEYKSLKETLITLVNNIPDEDVIQKPLMFTKLLRPGKKYKDIIQLRELLAIEPLDDTSPKLYTDDLVNTVKKIQSENELIIDGIIGKQTLAILNKTHQDKLNQIIINMERIRWIPKSDADKVITVNIPSATLTAVHNGEIKFKMPVVIGRKKRQTKSFTTKISGVRFNPTWTVPPTIMKEDMLPRLRDEPSYFVQRNMSIYSGFHRDALKIDPYDIAWNGLSEAEMKGLRIVQEAGLNNPLGLFRLIMPNKYNIYLHDTNHKELFTRSYRAKSSGCVRLADPRKVVSFVLEKRRGWKEKVMKRILKEGETKVLSTPNKIPVYLLYNTVWLNKDNNVIYGDDIYDKDKKLLALLDDIEGYNYNIPEEVKTPTETLIVSLAQLFQDEVLLK